MVHEGRLGLAVAQVGGINLSDTRSAVVSRLVGMMREAKARGASVVVYPELTLTTFFPRHWFDHEDEADRFFEREMPNEQVQPLFDWAKELEVGFYLGYAELTGDGRRFNTSILVEPSGRIVGKYRKVHLPGSRRARARTRRRSIWRSATSRSAISAFLCGRLDGAGMCICNDRRWPETYRVLGLQGRRTGLARLQHPVARSGGAITTVSPAFTTTSRCRLARIRTDWVRRWPSAGRGRRAQIGQSAIVAPSGEIVARAVTEEDEVVVAEVDLGLAKPYRESVFNFAAHRQPLHYRLIVDRVGRGDPLPVQLDETAPQPPPAPGLVEH